MNAHLADLCRRLLAKGAKAEHISASECHDLVGEVDNLDDELTRLRKALWALTTGPWVDVAPGLRPYVYDVLISGQVQLDPEHEAELRAFLKENDK